MVAGEGKADFLLVFLVGCPCSSEWPYIYLCTQRKFQRDSMSQERKRKKRDVAGGEGIQKESGYNQAILCTCLRFPRKKERFIKQKWSCKKVKSQFNGQQRIHTYRPAVYWNSGSHRSTPEMLTEYKWILSLGTITDLLRIYAICVRNTLKILVKI